jgi:SAM-dependent methyltransferase
MSEPDRTAQSAAPSEPQATLRSDLEHFRERYQHAWNKIEWHVPAELKRGRFLDLGCGIGNGVAAAAAHGATLSIGIDRSLGEFGHQVMLEEFPQLCEAVGSPHGSTLLVEGDIFGIGFPPGTFDYALMLDSAEHVPNVGAFFARAFSALRPGGYFIVDTCPLYYSPVGHHLWPWFPENSAPWAHLRPDFPDRCRELGVDSWHMERVAELNRATHDDIRSAFRGAGFEIVQEHRAKPDAAKLALFDRFGPDLNLDGVQWGSLFEDWILLVGRKP